MRRASILFLLLVSLVTFSASACFGKDTIALIDDILKQFSANVSLLSKCEAEYGLLSQIPPQDLTSKDARRLESLTNKVRVLRDANDKLKYRLEKEGLVEKDPLLYGSDWMKMRLSEKEYYVFKALGALEEEGAVFSRVSYDYLEILDRKITGDPRLQQRSLGYLFLSTISETDPINRPFIDKFFRQHPELL